jgi:hypothetical protein
VHTHCRAAAYARVAELADAYGSGPYGETRGGSSPLASSNFPLTFNRINTNATVPVWLTGHFLPEAFLLAAHRAFISSESFFRPAGVSAPFFLAGAFFVPPAFLLAAQRAFINWESFLRPAGVSWPFLLLGDAVAAPLSLAQRALAAAASFARVPGEK